MIPTFSRDSWENRCQRLGVLNCKSQKTSRLSLFAVLSWVGCLLASVSGVAAAEPAWPVSVQDALRRTVTVQAAPQRIVSLTPANTEILFALGCGDRVVGVTTFCDYPAEAKSRAKVGGFAASTVNIESLLALRPDLVVTGDEYHRKVVESLTKAGVPTVAIKASDFPGVFASMITLGKLTGQSKQAEALVQAQRARVDAVVARASKIRQVDRLRVYWEVFDAPVITTGPNTIIGQLIALSGGLNVFADIDSEFPQISTEAVIARDPQVILGPKVENADSLSLEKVRARAGWKGIDAVRKGHVYAVSADLTSRPGPRLVDGLELVARTLYPERFPAPSAP